MTHPSLHIFVAFISSLLVPLVSSQSCATDQNPYCAKDAAFANICCTYPNVCYYSDRDGTPACCPWGQSCQAAGGVITAQQPTLYTTQAPVAQSTVQQPSYSTVTSYVTHPQTAPPAGGIVTLTTTEPDVWEGATSTIAGAYSTVTSNVAGAYSTVTSAVASVATGVATTVVSGVAGAATDFVNVLNEGEQNQVSWVALAVALGVGVWCLV